MKSTLDYKLAELLLHLKAAKCNKNIWNICCVDMCIPSKPKNPNKNQPYKNGENPIISQ